MLFLCGGVTIGSHVAIAKNTGSKHKPITATGKALRKNSQTRLAKRKKQKVRPALAKSHREAPAKAASQPKTTFKGPYSLAVSQGLGEILNCDPDYSSWDGDYASCEVSENPIKYSYPSAVPAEGYLTSGYGRRRSPFHDRLVQHRGLDYSVPKGSPIYATADGLVVFSGWRGSFGKTVIIDHGNGVMTVYAHASKLLAKVGDSISRGAVVAKVGSTGRSTGPHLHYEIWVNGRATNPVHFQRSGEAKVLLVNARD
jgi:murein DD-endopeptidase MepM/ murein hydrolase activator NlpD